MTCVLVLAAGHAWEPAALGLLEARHDVTVLKRCVDVDDLLATATTGQADAAVIALDASGLDATAVDHLRRHAVHPVLVSTTPLHDLGTREQASRLAVGALLWAGDLTGLPDLVHEGSGPDTIERAPDLVGGLPEPAQAGEDEPRRTIVVWGPAGAPGRTSVAVNLAAELARRSRPVVLADMDPQGGSIAQHLGILDEVSGVLAGARLAASGHLVERFGSICRGVGEGLAVVTGLPRADRWREVRPAHIDQLLEAARTRADVVVDTGASIEDETAGDLGGRTPRNAMTLGALAQADEIVVVGAADPVGLARLARALIDLREVAGHVPLRVVVNRMRPTIGWSEREVSGMVEGFVQAAGLHFLPEDRPGLDRALVSGQAVVAVDDSAWARGIRALVDAVFPESVGERPRRRPLLGLRPRTAGTDRQR